MCVMGWLKLYQQAFAIYVLIKQEIWAIASAWAGELLAQEILKLAMKCLV